MSHDLFEMLNGSSVTPILLLQIWLIRYLAIESRKRGLRWWNWFHLPAHMDLVLAMFVFDTGVLARSFFSWAWRFFGAGDVNAAEMAGLIAGGFLIVLGALCKIRALTRPEGGNGPWLASAAATALAVAVLLLLMLAG